LFFRRRGSSFNHNMPGPTRSEKKEND